MNLFRNKNFLLLVFLSLNLLMINSCRTEEAKDSDKDGVVDSEDKCPYLKGYVQYKGCPANISGTDIDGDGIENMRDKCPDVAGLEEFDGCPDPEDPYCEDRGDNDGDGVLNCYDLCPNKAGKNGRSCPCENDSDKDGVNDCDDLCPKTEAGANVDKDGCSECSKDDDRDGVDNCKDKCPSTPLNTKVDKDGCPKSIPCDEPNVDTDKDGVVDCNDKCPNTLSSVKVDEKGCCIQGNDTDRDGVDDCRDKCPNTPSNTTVNSKGCPIDDCGNRTLAINMPKTTIPSLSTFSPSTGGSNWDKTEWNFGSGYSSSSSKSFTRLGLVTIKARGTSGGCVQEASETAVVVLSKAHLKREIDKLKNYVTLSTAAIGDNKQDAIDRREDKKDEIMELLFRGDGNIIVDVRKGKNSRRSVNGFPRDFEFFYKQLLMTPDIYSGVVDLEVLETTTGQAKKIILYK